MYYEPIDGDYLNGHFIYLCKRDNKFDVLVVRRDGKKVLEKHYKTYQGAERRYTIECAHYRALEEANWFD